MQNGEQIVSLEWLGDPPSNARVTFGVPWPRGKYWPDRTSFVCGDETGDTVPLQTWTTAYWPDGSIKWTGHAIADDKSGLKGYSVKALVQESRASDAGIVIKHDELDKSFHVNTGKASVVFSTEGSDIVRTITNSSGKCIASNGRLLLLSRSDQFTQHRFQSHISEVNVEQEGPVRAVVAVRGTHHSTHIDLSHPPWLPFTLRFYLYHNSEEIRTAHTIIYDGNPQTDLIQGIGIRFNVPFDNDPPHDRHVRFAGVDGGIFSEAVQGVTGLWKDPGSHVRSAQVNGQPTPPIENWDNDVGNYMKWVPCWNDYTLTQLSPDGYTMKKRTSEGHSWVNIPGGTRAGGLAYLGSASRGGLGIGMRYFWERYPAGLDIRDANTATGEVTLWLYSPLAEAMDLRPYHDGLQQDTYNDQLDALRITYEDWEDGTGTPYGIARTNEISLFAFDKTPSSTQLSNLVHTTRNPPVLIPDRNHILQTKALGAYWSPTTSDLTQTPSKTAIETNLSFLFTYYQTQISQRRWYGFWDHGDIMHTYDEDRHTWRYDIGGYAWDNSELSPDLFFWLYFLRTGREDVYRLAEALTRHTGEVDAYHIGPWKGLGTRHGVQHWSDSCKQARVSNSIYRRIFYYLTGGEQRTGELLEETLHAEKTILVLDPYRKVRRDRGSYVPSAEAISISLGTDWSAFAAAWFVAWERRIPGWEDALKKLRLSMEGIGKLRNGFVTGMALYNIYTGEISLPPNDPENKGTVKVSHLSAMFGLFEICAELIDTFSETQLGFHSAWLDYCQYFNASEEDQTRRYDEPFGHLILRQGHSRLTAYAARQLHDAGLARRAWREFYTGDGYAPDLPWRSEIVTGSLAPVSVEEAGWVSTNISSLYGLAAIQNLALVGGHLAGEEELTS